MRVICEVVGGQTETIHLPADADYAALLSRLGFSRHEATVLVDGSPVPADAAVDADRVRVLRLVKGGAPKDGKTA
ncbi:ubiquitin-like small modifier protein SAMP2 [Halosegnis sp.]|uniref:ubiquitin-like small modifier protein SAMP2 n=1 Tax=Halosegnis sp. TaxID=2864959 RepID=UPI0035D51468